MASVVCAGIPEFLQSTKPSEPYRELFNKVAKEKGYPIEWVQDAGAINIPEPDLGELSATDPNFQITPDIICEVRQIIEGRRRLVNEQAHTQMRVVPSATFTKDVLDLANPAERLWLAKVAGDFQRVAQDIFGYQAHPNYGNLSRWMGESRGDYYSLHHFKRMRSVQSPKLEDIGGLAFAAKPEEYEDYSNVFPWFEAPPPFNGMFPADMTKEEIAYLSKEYDPKDPVRLPWTVVERVEGKALETSKAGQNSWLVRGEGDRWYRVTNMAFHPTYQKYFREVANLLRQHAFVKATDDQKRTHALHPEFRKFTLTMADCLERGDFFKLLKTDLDQTAGNLFLTFFPHEGYWPDQIKLPWMMEMGIRQPGAEKMPPEEAAVFQGLEDRKGEVAKNNGLKYEPRKINTVDLAKGVVMFWPWRTGGYMRAYFREPAGHDYPKAVKDPSLGTVHRNVILMDSSTASVTTTNQILRELVDWGEQAATETRVEEFLQFVQWHEGGHGTGTRVDGILDSGRIFSVAYGKSWGSLVEPLADSDAAWALGRRYEKGLLGKGAEANRKQYEKECWNIIAVELKRYYAKDIASLDKIIGNGDAAHVVGSTLAVAWMFKYAVFSWNAEKKKLVVDLSKFQPAWDSLNETLTVFSLMDLKEEYHNFLRATFAHIPDEADEVIWAARQQFGKPLLVDRDPQGTL